MFYRLKSFWPEIRTVRKVDHFTQESFPNVEKAISIASDHLIIKGEAASCLLKGKRAVSFFFKKKKYVGLTLLKYNHYSEQW